MFVKQQKFEHQAQQNDDLVSLIKMFIATMVADQVTFTWEKI